MKIKIDSDRCEGHGRCYTLAPDVYEPDDIGHGRVRNEDVPDHLVEQAGLGIRNCPENAISVTVHIREAETE